jgi:HEAT repeat protein
VNIKKTGILLISLLTVSAVLIAFNFERLESLFPGATAPETTADAPQPEPPSDTITQLMRQDSTPLPADNPVSQAVDEASSADDIQALEEALNDFYSSEDEQDRETALMILGEYLDPKAKEAILYALNDPEDSVREQAVSQIGNWEDEAERQQMLLAALQNDHPEIVVLTLESIDEIDDPALIQKIKELSNDKNEDISEAAKIALDMADAE